jgi:hypothetical protein
MQRGAGLTCLCARGCALKKEFAQCPPARMHNSVYAYNIKTDRFFRVSCCFRVVLELWFKKKEISFSSFYFCMSKLLQIYNWVCANPQI